MLAAISRRPEELVKGFIQQLQPSGEQLVLAAISRRPEELVKGFIQQLQPSGEQLVLAAISRHETNASQRA